MTARGRIIRTEIPEENFFEDQIPFDTKPVLITADEMRNFVDEWMRTGSTDLIVDNSLCKRIYQYIEYQRALGEAKGKLVEQELERYLVDKNRISNAEKKFVDFKLNRILLIGADVFFDEIRDKGVICLMRVRDFKRLVAGLGNKMISYAYIGNDELFIDYRLYLQERGIKLDWKDNTYNLILPPDWKC